MNLENEFNEENENIQEEVEQEIQTNEQEVEVQVQQNEEEVEQEVQENEEEVEVQVQEVQSDRDTQSEIIVDYKQDFIILQNLGYIQVVLTGFILFYFVFSLVYKYIKSFF